MFEWCLKLSDMLFIVGLYAMHDWILHGLFIKLFALFSWMYGLQCPNHMQHMSI